MHTAYMLWLNQYPVFGFVNIPLPMICVVMSKCYSNSSWSNEASSKVPTRRTLIHWVLQFTPAFQFHIIVRTPTIKEIHLPFGGYTPFSDTLILLTPISRPAVRWYSSIILRPLLAKLPSSTCWEESGQQTWERYWDKMDLSIYPYKKPTNNNDVNLQI